MAMKSELRLRTVSLTVSFALLIILSACARDAGSRLLAAAKKGNVNGVRVSLDEGVDIKTKDKDGKTAIVIAREKGYTEVVRVLSEAADSALLTAVREGELEEVKGLLEVDADVNTSDRGGHNPLHLAARYGHKDMVLLLVEKGADVNAENIFGDTPLRYALAAFGQGDKDVIELLIKNGADVNAVGDGALTPLHSAHSMKDVAELLISNGARLNARDANDWTPLHSAASGGDKDVVKLLIEKGAEVDAKTKGGKTALTIAEEKGHKEIVRLLNNIDLIMGHLQKLFPGSFPKEYHKFLGRDQEELILSPILLRGKKGFILASTIHSLALKGGNLLVTFEIHLGDPEVAIATLIETEAHVSDEENLILFHMIMFDMETGEISAQPDGFILENAGSWETSFFAPIVYLDALKIVSERDGLFMLSYGRPLIGTWFRIIQRSGSTLIATGEYHNFDDEDLTGLDCSFDVKFEGFHKKDGRIMGNKVINCSGDKDCCVKDREIQHGVSKSLMVFE